jgi:hypothetical protein
MNWSDLAQKKILAPFAPKITDELDISNFSVKFTEMIPADVSATLSRSKGDHPASSYVMIQTPPIHCHITTIGTCLNQFRSHAP